jgi:hypothetical protein
MDFGLNGEVRVYKRWRSLEPYGNVTTLIPPKQVLIKLSSGEVLDPPMCCPSLLTVDNIRLGYFEKYPSYPTVEDSVIDIEPVWILEGTLPRGNQWDLSIPAMENSTLETQSK